MRRSIYTLIWLAGFAGCNLPMASETTPTKGTGSATSSTIQPGQKQPASSKGPVSSKRPAAIPSPQPPPPPPSGGEGALAADAPPLMQAMRDALNRDEMAVVQGKARTLMDAAANVSAEGIRSLAHRLERASRTNQVAEAAALLDQLGHLLDVLDQHVGHATV